MDIVKDGAVMKRYISLGSFAFLSLLLTHHPAQAEVTVTIINDSSSEINYLHMNNGEVSIGSSMNLVPGNKINMTDGSASVIKGMSVFAGTNRYDFDEINLTGLSNVFRFVLNGEGVATLEPEKDANVYALGDSFDVEDGPIFNNDHAKKRCPEVVAEWMSAHPGVEAEWTGNWNTVFTADASVCNLRITKLSGDQVNSSTKTFIGKTTSLIPEGVAPADFNKVLKATKIADLRPLNIVEASDPFAGNFFLPVSFAKASWLARIIPYEGGDCFLQGSIDECTINNILLRVDADKNVLKNTLQALSSSGYRPWFAYIKEKKDGDMAITDAMSFWDDVNVSTKSDAEQALAEASEIIFEETVPVSLDCVFVSEKNWEKALKGENPEAPVMRLHVTSNGNLFLVWMSDGSALMEASRGTTE